MVFEPGGCEKIPQKEVFLKRKGGERAIDKRRRGHCDPF